MNWTSILSMGFDKLISTVGIVLDDLFTSKEEKAQAQVALLTLKLQAEQTRQETLLKLEQAYVDDQKTLREQITTEIQSQDWFVRRARPAVIWTGIVMVIWDYMLIPMMETVYHLVRAQPVVVTKIEIPYEFWLVWGFLMGGIAILRTIDKRNMLAATIAPCNGKQKETTDG